MASSSSIHPLAGAGILLCPLGIGGPKLVELVLGDNSRLSLLLQEVLRLGCFVGLAMAIIGSLRARRAHKIQSDAEPPQQ